MESGAEEIQQRRSRSSSVAVKVGFMQQPDVLYVAPEKCPEWLENMEAARMGSWRDFATAGM
jgi:hypothetical protein